MKVVMASSPGHVGRPNEDFVGTVPGAVVLLDGAGIRGTDSICRHGVAWYSHTLGATLLGQLSREPGADLVAALADSIGQVSGRHRHTCDIANPSSPQSTVAIIRFTADRADYLVLADVSVVLDSPEAGPRVVTDSREVSVRSECASPLRGLPTGTPEYERMKISVIDALRARRNQPSGYWIAKDDPSVAMQAVTGSVSLTQLNGAALLSNGASRVVDPYRLAEWPAVLDLMRTKGPDEVLGRVREAETDARATSSLPLPDLRLSPDDATIAYCEPAARSAQRVRHEPRPADKSVAVRKQIRVERKRTTMKQHHVTVEVLGPWSLATSRMFWERFAPAALAGRDETERLHSVFLTDGDWTRAEVTVTQQGSTAGVTVAGDGDLAAAATQVCRFLALDVDARGWPDVGRRDPVIGDAQRQLPGLRPCGFHSPYEAAAWSVLSQRIRIVQAARLRDDLVRRHGDGGAFPAPHLLRRLELDLPGRKAEYLHAVADGALDGRLDGAALRALEPDEAVRTVQEVKGLGPFAAELVVIRGANAPDALPHHERRLDDEITERYGAGHPLAEVSAAWRPFRTWAAVHLRALREQRTHEIGG